MSDDQREEMRERLDRLEAKVEQLQTQLSELRRPHEIPLDTSRPDPAVGRLVSPSSLATHRIVRPPGSARRSPDAFLESLKSGSTEGLLNKVGIGLLLLGVIFLFKYSIDQGWITEPVRVLVGTLLGIGLIGVGYRVRSVRPRLAPVLQGGGVAVLYITVFAAFQLYGLIPHALAFGGMVCITGTAFVISVVHREAWLSLIAVAGGLATPFLLHTGAGSLAALVGYTCVVIAGAMVIYAYHGWRSLLLTSAAGALLVLIAAYSEMFDRFDASATERAVMQLGIGFYWLAFAAAPVIWEIARSKVPDTAVTLERALSRPSFVFAWAIPLIGIVFSQSLWMVGDAWGWSAVALAILYALAAVTFERLGFAWLAESHRFAAAFLVPVGLLYLLEGNWLLLALGLCLVASMGAAGLLRDRLLQTTMTGLLVVVALALAVVLAAGPSVTHFLLDSEAAASLLAICVVGAGPRAIAPGRRANVFLLGGHLLLLSWIFQEVGALPNGHAWATMVAAVYAMALLVLGLRRDVDALRLAGLFTILGVVAKLLLFDLAELDALWRILLFLGFGGVLLLLSYFVPTLWRGRSAPRDQAADVVA